MENIRCTWTKEIPQNTTLKQTSMISVETRYIAPSDPSLPAFALRITRLVDSYMIWIGTTELAPDAVEKAPELGRLCKDWACAMPPKTVCRVIEFMTTD